MNKGAGREGNGGVGATESPQHAVAFTFRDTRYCGRKLAQENPKMEYFTVNFGLDFSEESLPCRFCVQSGFCCGERMF